MSIVFDDWLHHHNDCRLQDGLASMRADFVQELRGMFDYFLQTSWQQESSANACSCRRLRESCTALSGAESAMPPQLAIMLGPSWRAKTPPPARPESMGNVMRPADWHMQSPAAWLPAASSSHRVLTMARPTVDARMQAASNALIAFDLLSVALCCAGLLASERFEPLADWQAAVAAVTAVQAQKPSKLARAFRHSYLTCCSSPSSKVMSLLASEAVNNDAMTASRSGLVCLQDCRIRRADDDDNAGGCCCCCCCWRCWGW